MHSPVTPRDSLSPRPSSQAGRPRIRCVRRACSKRVESHYTLAVVVALHCVWTRSRDRTQRCCFLRGPFPPRLSRPPQCEYSDRCRRHKPNALSGCVAVELCYIATLEEEDGAYSSFLFPPFLAVYIVQVHFELEASTRKFRRSTRQAIAPPADRVGALVRNREADKLREYRPKWTSLPSFCNAAMPQCTGRSRHVYPQL